MSKQELDFDFLLFEVVVQEDHLRQRPYKRYGEIRKRSDDKL